MLRRVATAVAALSVGAGVLVLGGSGAGAAPLSRPAVIGGSDASIAESPWQVAFIINEGTVCSGSFLSPTKIVSAAHCFVGIPQGQVQAFAGITTLSDRSNASRLSIASIANHPGFSFATYANDIAIVTLSKPAPVALTTRTIALPVAQEAAAWPAAGTSALISGWGETVRDSTVASNTLQSAQVQVLAGPGDANCGSYGGVFIPSDQICAGGDNGSIDACSGDSGGPLVIPVNGVPVLAGVVSTGQSCASAAYPGLYARVTTFLPWIASQGVDLKAAGENSAITAPGSDRDGRPAIFAIGGTYKAADFTRYTALKGKRATVKVTGGKACSQKGAGVEFTTAGKCSVVIASGSRRIPAVVTVYRTTEG